jgi:hypothetical protein
MLQCWAVAVPSPLRPTLLAVHSCTRQHANLLVPGQIIFGLVVLPLNSVEQSLCSTFSLHKEIDWEEFITIIVLLKLKGGVFFVPEH